MMNLLVFRRPIVNSGIFVMAVVVLNATRGLAAKRTPNERVPFPNVSISNLAHICRNSRNAAVDDQVII